MSENLSSWLIESFSNGCSVEIKITVLGQSILGELRNVDTDDVKYIYYRTDNEINLFFERLREICLQFVER